MVGIFTTSDDLAKEVVEASKIAREKLWSFRWWTVIGSQ